MALTLERAFAIPLLIILVTLLSQAKSRALDEPSIAQKHEQWMAHYKRNYLDSTERDTRFLIFKENYKYIEKFNKARNHTYKLGLGPFSDLKFEEFVASHTGLKMPTNRRVSKTASHRNQNLTDDIPESFDWRDQEAVNDIKYQGQCGCCWAFSAVAAMEGAVKIKTGQLPILSEQQLVDCDSYNHGCRGGWPDYAFRYIIENGGLAAESDYPFEAADGTCNQQKATNTVAQIKSFQDVAPNNEKELKIAVHQQPVSIVISVGPEFQHYTGGIYQGSCGYEPNHAVTLVGFGKSDEDDTLMYWLLRNSWGQEWGESGYMRILRESSDPQGHCGLAMTPSYPIL